MAASGFPARTRYQGDSGAKMTAIKIGIGHIHWRAKLDVLD